MAGKQADIGDVEAFLAVARAGGWKPAARGGAGGGGGGGGWGGGGGLGAGAGLTAPPPQTPF